MRAGAASDVLEDPHRRNEAGPQSLHRVGDVPVEPGQPLRKLHHSIQLLAWAYLKARGERTKVFLIKIAMATGVSGSETLTVTARNSGQEQTIPALTVEVDASGPWCRRPAILPAYRAKAGKAADGYFTKLPDLADHPVFSVTPL